MEEYPTTVNVAKKHAYNFWKGKPVSKFGDIIHTPNIIDQNITKRKNYSENQLALPKGLEWKEIKISENSTVLEQICLFLNAHSTESEKQRFKMEYTPDVLRLALGTTFGTILMIISQKTGLIYGLIGYTINNMTVFSSNDGFGICHFLCVHPTYRKKKVANLLIDESIRRLANGEYGVQMSCFMTEKCVPTPVCCVRQYRRPINYELLHKLKFAAIQKECTEKDIKSFQVGGQVDTSIVKMEQHHLKEVFLLLREFNMKFNVHRNYTIKELENELLGNEIVSSYVVIGADSKVLDFMTFFDTTYLECNENPEKIKSRNFYLYTCVNTTQDFILQNSLRIAQRDNIDVVTTTDCMLLSNSVLMKEFEVDEESDSEDRGKIYEYKFVRGGSKLYLNFFNWKCPKLKPIQLSAFWFNY